MSRAAFMVGRPATITVHYEGKVSAVGKSTVTVEGFTIPTTLGPGVRTVSAGRLTSVCDRDHCDDGCCDGNDGSLDSCGHEGADELLRAVRDRHDVHHNSSFRFCPDAICKAGQDVEGWAL